MGVPKFYRWISERYPCLSQKIREYQIPDFDNLYLDMNGIIHGCSHPNDEDVHLRIPEECIFRDIFKYIDFLFKMIKPKKVFFMAVDGVAPRAKMNQQRGRRFRSARMAQEQEAEAIRAGEVLPSDDRFDSNCITPGTDFMARLHEQLKYFVQVKISTDPLWQSKELKVYLSGHNFPGEGEHKIMDYIRHIRSKPDYDPSTRHCLYGLDADLIMLGLSSHELRFSLLREEVKFTRQKKKPKNKVPNKGDKKDIATILPLEENPIRKTEIEDKLVNLLDGISFADKAKQAPVPLLSLPLTLELDKSENGIFEPPAEKGNAKGTYKPQIPEKITFHLLHLSLFRDYIDEEFAELKKILKNHPTIQYDLESVIDDWILMNILVGNDFVPNLTHMHIVKGALPMLYRNYISILPTLDGYINESGHLNLRRFEKFMQSVSQYDLEIFRENYDDMKYMASKTGKNIVLGDKMFEDFDFGGDAFEEDALELSPEIQALVQRTENEIDDIKNNEGRDELCSNIFSEQKDFFDKEDSKEFILEFHQQKKNYYSDKFEHHSVTKLKVQNIAEEYVRAIQWVLLYYYKGVSSWGWYYPFHYAPFASDLNNISDFKIEFDKGLPFRPFEQLLGVLPAYSKKFLPICFQWLMTEEKSPIIEYYPQEFRLDLNGKKQDWEAVVLIPFIDEKRLLTAMEIEIENLTAEEAQRNSKGPMMIYSFTKENTGKVYSANNVFSPLEVSHVKAEQLFDLDYNPKLLPKGLHPNTKIDTVFQGFPTLKSLPHSTSIENAEVKIFDFISREESLLIYLKSEENEESSSSIYNIADKILGKAVYVNWPHLVFALAVSVSDSTTKITLRNKSKEVSNQVTVEHEGKAKALMNIYQKFKGIVLGDVKVIVWAKPMEGSKIRCERNGKITIETQWGEKEEPFPLQTTIFNENIEEQFYADRKQLTTFTDIYSPGDKIFCLSDKFYGSLGTIQKIDKNTKSCIVNLNVPVYDNIYDNLDFLRNKLLSQTHYSTYIASERCGISTYVLTRITGSIFIRKEKNGKKGKRGVDEKGDRRDSSDSDSENNNFGRKERFLNIGLDLKFNKKGLKIRGYTKKVDNQWQYSQKAINLITEFVNEFRELIDFLEYCDRKSDNFAPSEIFRKDAQENIEKVKQWIEDKGVHHLTKIPISSDLLDDEDINTIWKHILEMNKAEKFKSKEKTITIQPQFLYKPGLDKGIVGPVGKCINKFLDRIICIDPSSPVTLGQMGTIVGIETPTSNQDDIEESFKSTSSKSLETLVILIDPSKEATFITSKQTENNSSLLDVDLGSTLASMLNLSNVVPLSTENKTELNNEEVLLPKLVKLYPHQIINMSFSMDYSYQNPFLSFKQQNKNNNNNNFSSMQQQQQGPQGPSRTLNFKNNYTDKKEDEVIKILRRPPQLNSGRPNPNISATLNTNTNSTPKPTTNVKEFKGDYRQALLLSTQQKNREKINVKPSNNSNDTANTSASTNKKNTSPKKNQDRVKPIQELLFAEQNIKVINKGKKENSDTNITILKREFKSEVLEKKNHPFPVSSTPIKIDKKAELNEHLKNLLSPAGKNHFNISSSLSSKSSESANENMSSSSPSKGSVNASDALKNILKVSPKTTKQTKKSDNNFQKRLVTEFDNNKPKVHNSELDTQNPIQNQQQPHSVHSQFQPSQVQQMEQRLPAGANYQQQMNPQIQQIQQQQQQQQLFQTIHNQNFPPHFIPTNIPESLNYRQYLSQVSVPPNWVQYGMHPPSLQPLMHHLPNHPVPVFVQPRFVQQMRHRFPQHSEPVGFQPYQKIVHQHHLQQQQEGMVHQQQQQHHHHSVANVPNNFVPVQVLRQQAQPGQGNSQNQDQNVIVKEKQDNNMEIFNEIQSNKIDKTIELLNKETSALNQILNLTSPSTRLQDKNIHSENGNESPKKSRLAANFGGI